MANAGKKESGWRLAYRFRLYPTKEQQELIERNMSACRFVYNHYLKARQEAYERTQHEVTRPKPVLDGDGRPVLDDEGREVWERSDDGKIVYCKVPNPGYVEGSKAMSYFDTSKDLTRLKRELLDRNGVAWLRQADSIALGYSHEDCWVIAQKACVTV